MVAERHPGDAGRDVKIWRGMTTRRGQRRQPSRPLTDLVIGVDDPTGSEVQSLLQAHLAFNRAVTPPGHVHALELDGLLDPSVTFFSAKQNDRLLGIAALKRLDDSHAEVKSMHTDERARGRGVGRALVDHLLRFAAEQGYARVSLETGAMEAFAPARSLYESCGFMRCDPFGAYSRNPYSTCMTIWLRPESSPARENHISHGVAHSAGQRSQYPPQGVAQLSGTSRSLPVSTS
jgi:putative acetyltransferase